ncbi:MAG: hypothetical protein KDI17_13870 [Halioglobus sp.]|nr:hypothetical protein [Halioglobus sp.]
MNAYKTLAVAPTLQRCLVAASVACGALSLLFSAFFWARFHIDIPIQDTLRLLPVVQAFIDSGWGGVPFQDWVSPHASAHRVAVGRLLMALEYRYLDGDNSLFYLGSWLSIAVLCYLYFRVARLGTADRAGVSVFMLGMALIYTCSYTQTYNLVFPINALWYICAACSALSVYLMLFPVRELTAARALSACFFAVLAAYSVFSGVITCLVISVLALRYRNRQALWVPVLMLPFVILYLQQVKSGEELVLETLSGTSVHLSLGAQLLSVFDKRERLPEYVVAFLTSPLSATSSPLPYLFLAPSLCLVIYGWVNTVRRRCSTETTGGEAETFYLAMATICLGTAIACFVGRSFSDPTVHRYQTIVMLYWLSITGLLLHSIPVGRKPLARVAVMLLLLLAPAFIFYQETGFNLMAGVKKHLYATETEITTRLGAPNFRDPRFSGRRFSPDYIAFERFLIEHTPLGKRDAPDPDTGDRPLQNCEFMRIRVGPDRGRPDQLRRIKLTVEGKRLQRFRRARISDGHGLYGYLYPNPKEPTTIAKLVWDDTVWTGYFRGSLGDLPLQLVFEAALGPDVACRLPSGGRA